MQNSMTIKEMNQTKITPFSCPITRSIRKVQSPPSPIETEKSVPWPITPEEGPVVDPVHSGAPQIFGVAFIGLLLLISFLSPQL